MKKLLILPLLSSMAFAELTGSFGIIGGQMEVIDNFDDHSINHTIYSRDTKPKTFDRYLLLPSMDLDYNGFFAKVETKDGGGFKAGYSWGEDSAIYAMKDGFGIEHNFYENFFYKIEKFNEDKFINPYLINQERGKKESDSLFIETGVKEYLELVDLKLAYYDMSIDDEVNSDVKQSGKQYDLESLVYVLPFVGLGLNYGMGNFDGDSNDYTKLGYKLALRWMFGDSARVMLEMSKNEYDFDVANSYFNKIRDEEENSIFFMYMQEGLLGDSNMFLTTMYFQSETTSNIDFFYKQNKGLMVNIGYKF